LKKGIVILLIHLLGSIVLFSQGSGSEISKKVSISGQVSLFGSTYTTTDSFASLSPKNYGVSLAFSLKTKYITLPFSFRYANNGRNASYPFIRYGIAPKYKWAKFYLGNNNINFSRYAFTGLNVFGIGFEINPSIFYLGAFTGRFQKAVFIDSTDVSYQRILPRYQTKGYVIKAGIKSRKNAVLFCYSSGADDENSIKYFNPKYKLSPRKSKSLGSEILLTLYKNFAYQFNGGMSIFTRNINAFDIDIFLRNSGENKLPSWARSIEKNPNITTSLAFAYDHLLSYGGKTFHLNLRYKYIQPEYKALSLANINTDLTQMSIEPGFKLLKQKLNVNFVYGIQSNNVNKKLLTQNKNTIFNFNANYTPNDRFNTTIVLSNFGIVSNAANPEQVDSISIQNVSSNININSYYALSKSIDITNSLNISLSIQGLKEIYEFNPLFNKTFTNTNANINYNHNAAKGHSYSLGVNYNNSYSQFLSSQNINGNVKSYGANATYSIPVIVEKLLCSFNGSFNLAGAEGEKAKPAIAVGISATLTLSKKSNLVVSYNLSKMTISEKDITQNYFNANITQNF
jgi:hypothetical protein